MQGVSSDQARCSVHNKVRSLDALVDDGGGGYCCAEDRKCRTGNPADMARIPCKFWQQNRCEKGDDCPFLHGSGFGGMGGKGGKADGCGSWYEEDWSPMPWGGKGGCGMPPMPYMMGMMMDTWSMMMAKGCGGGMYGMEKGKPPPHYMAKGKSKGYEDWDVGRGSPQSKVFCSLHNKPRTAANLEEIGNGRYQCRRGSECHNADASLVKRTLCRYFAEGSCARGENCTFAHSEEEIGEPVPEGAEAAPGPPQMGFCVLHKKPRTISCLVEQGDGTWACKETCECKVGGVDGTKQILCKFFELGKCAKGKACVYAHGEDDIGQPVEDPPPDDYDDIEAPPARFVGRGAHDAGVSKSKGKGPSFGAPYAGDGDENGFCSVHKKRRTLGNLEPDGNGSWCCKPGSTCMSVKGADGVKRSMCKFFLEGTCSRGDSCVFAHSPEEIGDPIPESSASDAPASGPPEQGLCVQHRKMRIMNCLEETEDGDLICRRGSECKVDGGGSARDVDKGKGAGRSGKGKGAGAWPGPGDFCWGGGGGGFWGGGEGDAAWGRAKGDAFGGWGGCGFGEVGAGFGGGLKGGSGGSFWGAGSRGMGAKGGDWRSRPY